MVCLCDLSGYGRHLSLVHERWRLLQLGHLVHLRQCLRKAFISYSCFQALYGHVVDINFGAGSLPLKCVYKTPL